MSGGFPFGMAGPFSGLRRSVVDPVTGQPVITSQPTGEVRQRSAVLPVARDDSGALVPAVPQGLFDAIDAVRFPGQVARGEKGVFDPATGHVSDEALGAASGIAGLAMTGSLPFSAPAGALRMFGGRSAKTADLGKLSQAEGMAAKGADRQAVWDDTGWFKGVDGQWRFEIPDDLAALESPMGAPKGYQALQHPDLQDAYPTMWGRTQQSISPDAVRHGSFDRQSDTVTARGPNDAERRSVAVHEFQHAVQKEEGFARGSSLRAQEGAPDADVMGAGLLAAYARQSGDADLLVKAERALEQAKHDRYRRHAGEVEARNVQARMDWTPEQRREIPPWVTQDTPDERQIFGIGAGLGLAGAGAAALASTDGAQAAPTPNSQAHMTAGSPFGFGPLPQVSAEDLATLMRRAPLGPQQAFTGTTGVTLPEEQPVAPQGLAFTPMPPRRPSEQALGLIEAPDADVPAPSAVPAAGRAPLSLAPPPAPAGAPAAPASASPTAAQPAGPAEPFFGERLGAGLDRFRKAGGFETLGNIGVGLLSAPTFGGGLAAGLRLDQDASVKRAATNLAQAEYGLKARKLQQEEQGQNATKNYLLGKGLDQNLAAAAMANPSVLSSVLGQLNKDPSVVEIAGNKYSLRPGEKPSDANLLGPAKDPNDADRYVLSDLQDGSKIAVNRTDPTDVKVIAPGQVARPATEEERRAFGVAAGTAVKMTAKDGPVAIGGATTNVSVAGPEKAQDQVVGKAYGDLQVDFATKGRNAASTLNTLSLMEQAMRTPGFYSGIAGEGVKRANQALVALGVKDARAASPAEVFDALSNKVVLDGLGGSLGPGISNTDRDYIARTAPTLAQSEQGNRDLIGIARSLAQRQQAVAKLARDYAGAHGGRLDAGFDQQLEDFAAQNPLFPQAQSTARASAPQEPPQGAPPGTRMAPDGRFYAADPARPGKFLLVR